MERTVERELIPMAKALYLGVLAWSPLARGVSNREISGRRQSRRREETNDGLKAFPPEEQRAAPIISALKSVAAQTGRSLAQVALDWLRHQTVPVIPIIGARKVAQLQDNLGSFDLELSAETCNPSTAQAESNSDSPRVFTRKNRFVQLWIAGCGIAPCSRATVSGRILSRLGFNQELPGSAEMLDSTPSPPQRHWILGNKQQWADCRIIFELKHDSWDPCSTVRSTTPLAIRAGN